MTSTSSTSSTTSSTASLVSALSSTVANTTATAASTTSTSIGAQLLTSLGVGTGINMDTLATEMATAQYATATTNVTNQLSAVSVEISDATTLKGYMSSLTSSFYSLVSAGSLASSPTVTNSQVASATLPEGQSGASTSYSLEVSQLAQSQVLASSSFSSSSATTGSGTLSIQFGTATAATSTAAASFTADSSKSAVSITVNQGDSLATIAQSINNSGAGLSAYVSSNADGTAQLVLKGPTGADNAFTITASENSADPGLSALNWNPASTSSTMSSAQGAQDASYKLDGISHTSASNTIANAAPGLSLSLTGTNAGAPTTITYSDPSSAITTAMTNLTSTLNQIITTMNGYMTPSTSGSLANDPGAMALQTALTQLPGETIMPNATGTAPATLADLGLTLAKDGSLTLDTTKLSSILTSNPSGVAAMFTTGLNGIYGTLFNISSAVSSSTDPGSLEGSITYYTAQQTTLQSQQTAIATQQASLRTQLLSQLTNADTAVATSNSTLTFLKNQIAAWNKTSN